MTNLSTPFSFMTRFAQMSPSPKCLARFKSAITDYILAVSEEAELRDNDRVLSIESYFLLRRENSAVRPCFGLFEFIHKTELPDAVFEDTVFQRIYRNGVDLVWIANVRFLLVFIRDLYRHLTDGTARTCSRTKWSATKIWMATIL